LVLDYNTEIIFQETPVKENFSFDGWYIDEELIEPFSFLEMPAYDFTIFAKWIPITYQVDYYVLPEGFNPLMDEIVLEEPDFTHVSLGAEFTLALTNENEVFTWGDNRFGQLGNGLNESRYRPVNITENFNLQENDYIIQLATGYLHSAALSQSGRVYFWGDNEFGQLGTDDFITRTIPVDITNNFTLAENEYIVKIECGNYFSSAITSSGRLFMWGDNDRGQIGTGDNLISTLPIDITAGFELEENEKIIQTSLGGSHSLALTSLNRVFSWGYNSLWQLGDGTTSSRSTPGEITSRFALNIDEEIVQISTGNHHSAAVTSFGNLFVFGYNFFGQLGDGTTTNNGTPTNITGQFLLDMDEKIEKVFLGVHFSAAITNKSSIFTWGLNTYGQLGDNTTVNSSNPINISGLFAFNNEKTAVEMSLGDRFIAIVDSQGNMNLWGDNVAGKLGIGTTTPEKIPHEPEFMIPEVITMNYDTVEIYDLLIPEREGDIFLGWYKNYGLTEEFDNLITSDGPTILYSKWHSYPAILLQETVFLDIDDIHYYYFTITNSSTIIIYTISDIDTFGILLDNEENIIAEDDDSYGEEYNFMITFELEPGVYVIVVRAYDYEETGDYTIVIRKN